MTEPVSPLDSELRSLVRADPPAPADARDRVRARLAVAIPGMLPRPSGAPAGAAAAAALGSLETAALVTAAFLLGGVAGAALFARLAREPQRVVYVDRPVPQVVAMDVPPVRSEPSQAKSAIAEAPPLARAAAPAPAAPSSPPPPHASQLAAERMVLDEARAALVQGAPDRAIELLGRHAARFPSAILGEERDAMQVEALVDAGRPDEARARAAAFRAQRPNSLFQGTVDSAIASIR